MMTKLALSRLHHMLHSLDIGMKTAERLLERENDPHVQAHAKEVLEGLEDMAMSIGMTLADHKNGSLTKRDKIESDS